MASLRLRSVSETRKLLVPVLKGRNVANIVLPVLLLVISGNSLVFSGQITLPVLVLSGAAPPARQPSSGKNSVSHGLRLRSSAAFYY